MQFRPEYRLGRLRMMLDHAGCSRIERQDAVPLLHLRWLRTMVVDLSHTAGEREVDVQQLALQQRSGCTMVERVVCKDLKEGHLSLLLSFLTQSVLLLTSLDLRACAVGDDLLLAVAVAHNSSLRRLYLPRRCSVTQSTLDRFTQLEELDATECENLANVDFCSATLRVLYANACNCLSDAGLRKATRLEVLHVGNCINVTDVAPFAHCLLELDASHDCGTCCGIGSAALADCHHLQALHAYDNDKISSLQPFAQRLRELDAGGCTSALNDAALADATGLVSLLCLNSAITTVEPFGTTLRRLDATCSNIDDAGLVTATNIVYLDASYSLIRSVAPFSASLLELDCSVRDSPVSEVALALATKLIWLNLNQNMSITTLPSSCGRSLRHLVASGKDCALTDAGLSTATKLVTLDCRGNRKLTAIEPCLENLQELTVGGTSLLRVGAIADAAELHRVVCLEDSIDADTLLCAAGFAKGGPCTWCRAV